MISKIVYAASHYLALLIFLCTCWGLGRALIRRLEPRAGLSEPGPTPLWHGLAAALGMGVVICLVQWLAIAGQLRLLPLLAVLGIGLCMFWLEWRALPGPAMARHWWPASWLARAALLLIALLVLPTLVAPLCPPLAWDEVMYHLPHAQQWAASGRLGVNEWLRYPWFPYNADLLFSAAMLMVDDVMPHLISALAAWLTAVLIYMAGKRYAGQGVASIATVIFLWLTRNEYANAMVDNCVTLFIFAGSLAFHVWLQQSHRRALLAMAAFLLGVAAGMKYQALLVLPLLALVLLVRTRSPRDWLVAVVGLLLPCVYWYARNYLLTGDPFNPLGGKLFGFSDWNAADYQLQFDDIKRNFGWPSWLLWPALLTPFAARVRRLPGAQAAMIFGAFGTVVWLLTAHYPRYLMPFYPVLALLAAAGWHWLFVAVCARLSGGAESRLQSRAAAACVALALLATMPFAVKTEFKNWKLVAPTAEARESVLQQQIAGYPVLAYLREHPVARTYQFGLEDSLYYAPPGTGGDHFGPGRYRDVAGLAPADMAKALRRAGYATLLIHAGRWPGIDTKPGFAQFFTLLRREGPVSLYQIIEPG